MSRLELVDEAEDFVVRKRGAWISMSLRLLVWEMFCLWLDSVEVIRVGFSDIWVCRGRG